MRRYAIVMAAVLLAGCPKKSDGAGDAGAKANGIASENANANASTDASANANASADGGANANAGASTGSMTAYAGKYSVSAGSMYVPAGKDWSTVKFTNDETKMLGDGEMTLSVAPSGRVSGGTEGGPLGATVIDGSSQGGALTATIRRKDPADDGLTGTLVAKITGDVLEGTMKLAEGNATVVRVGKLDAKKK